jgi:hypothetical protein
MNGLGKKPRTSKQASAIMVMDLALWVCAEIFCMFDSFVFQKSWQGNGSGSSQHDDDNKQTKQITHCERVLLLNTENVIIAITNISVNTNIRLKMEIRVFGSFCKFVVQMMTDQSNPVPSCF